MIEKKGWVDCHTASSNGTIKNVGLLWKNDTIDGGSQFYRRVRPFLYNTPILNIGTIEEKFSKPGVESYMFLMY